ncbi:lipopolysaccharide biosynthesis protein [Streptomyces venezuelae]|uniref:Lipopolysaccharide biosynthesis protein n=1 Tax=Streptomyces venezuelae TaxID=54571 RepID=A0A5P2DHB7_STRVZ|nr:lipopolysaccharide biosynthesis protein [Streptomyces venezuelae]QES52389.1 lipopolysaccharide biosynthesis protein [Streptomyces venezuelae]
MADTSDQKKAEPGTESGPGTRAERRSARGDAKPRRGRGRRLLSPPAWWPLPACALLGLAAGGAYGVLKAPEYAATSYVVAVPDETTEPATALGFAQAYARIATSSATLAYAQPRAGLTAQRLRTQVRAETSPESPMIAITGTSKSPAQAADIANAVADALSLSSNQAAKNTGVQLLLFNQAVAPTDPASPSAPISGAVGLCAGGLAGGLWLLARPGRRRTEAGTEAGTGAGTGAGNTDTPQQETAEVYVASLPAQGEGNDAVAGPVKEKEPAR